MNNHKNRPRAVFAMTIAAVLAGTGVALGEDTVNGCIAADAVDLTGLGASVSITATFQAPAIKQRIDPSKVCLKIRLDQRISMEGTGVVGGPMVVGGTVDASGAAAYAKTSPIQPSCFNGATAPDPNKKACYSGGAWPCANVACKAFAPGAYGFYNNSNQAQRGALYVAP
jgi:hypothetical protein